MLQKGTDSIAPDADPERRQKYLEKECEKYRKDLESGRKKLINDLSPREKGIMMYHQFRSS